MSELFDKHQSNELAWREITSAQKGGFNFDNSIRNKLLLESKNTPIKNANINNSNNSNQSTSLNDSIASQMPKAWKTGTTICGITYKGGVVLGADTRATGGSEVVDKNCEKIHYLAPNIWCCGAGTAADTEKTTELIASNLELLRLSTNTQSRVITALTLLKRHLYKYQGHVSAACVLGGTDIHGPHMYCVHPAGSTQRLPYVTMGSGSLAAMAVFEARYCEDLDETDAVTLVRDAIRAGIFNDLGSGSNVDITVVRNDGSTTRHRTYENAAGSSSSYKALYTKPVKMTIPKNTTVVVKESFKPHKKTTTGSSSSSSSSIAMEVA